MVVDASRVTLQVFADGVQYLVELLIYSLELCILLGEALIHSMRYYAQLDRNKLLHIGHEILQISFFHVFATIHTSSIPPD